MNYIELKSLRVPTLGIGTWQLEGDMCRAAVRDALQLGYQHIDTASAYGNEADIGRAIHDSPVPRDALFITSKVWYADLSPEALLRSCHESLNKLQTDHLDLLLIHWPNAKVPLRKTLAALEEAVVAGLTRHVGVSNFPPALLSEALLAAPIECIQVECHPYLNQQELRHLARQHSLLFTAYSPLARGCVLKDPVLNDIGRRHGKTASQVALRWLVQQGGVAVIPKTASSKHLRENLDIFAFELDSQDQQRIAALHRNERLIDPDFAPDWNLRRADAYL